MRQLYGNRAYDGSTGGFQDRTINGIKDGKSQGTAYSLLPLGHWLRRLMVSTAANMVLCYYQPVPGDHRLLQPCSLPLGS